MTYSLREIGKADIPIINKWRNDKELIDLLGNNFLYISDAVDNDWFDNYMKNRQYAIRLAIIDTRADLLIGTVQLTSIHSINRSAEFSILIGDKNYWSKGAGSFSTKAMLSHGFSNMNLHRIYLTVLESNGRALSMYTKTGFKQEGNLREAIFKSGCYHNLILMSVLHSEFQD